MSFKYTNLHENLIAYWPMNGHTTNIVNKQNSIDTDIVYDSINDCITFNGTSSKIELDEPINILSPGEYTFSFWIFPIQNLSAPGEGLGGLFAASPYGFVYYSDFPNYQIAFSSNIITAAGSLLPYNQWHHIVCTISNSVIQFYENGVAAGQPGYLTIPLSFTKFGEYAGFYLENGIKLKDFYIWDRKLNDYEIQRMYHKENIFSKYIYDNDLLSHWSLNSSIKNYTGIPNVGSIGVSTYELGIKETSIRFNSATPTNITGAHAASYNTNTITCNAWIKAYSFPTNFLGIIDKYVGSTSGFYLDIESSTLRQPRFGIRSASTDYWINSTTQLSINNWYMITGIYDGSKLKIYVNGILEAEATISATINFNTHNVIIGGDNVSTLYFNGLIQDVAIWNKALNQSEITNLFNQSTSLYYRLVAFWKLDGNGNDLLNQYHTSTDNNITYNNTATRHTAIFNGSSSYYIAPTLTPVAGSNYLSISLWFYTSVADTCTLISEYSTVINNNAFFLNLDETSTRSLYFSVQNGDGDSGSKYAYTNTLAYSLNTWNHVVCVFDGTQTGNSNICKMYINGSQVTLNFVGTWGTVVNPNITYPLWIGSLFNNLATNSFNGQMDNIGVWNRPLTEKDITTLYEDGLQLPSAYKIVNYWPLQSDTVSEIATNTGIATNTTYSSGRINNAATFNGTSSYFYVNQIDSTLITFACWFKFTNNGQYQSIVRQGHTPCNFDLRLDETNQYRIFLVGADGSSVFLATGVYATPNIWVHVTVTYDWNTHIVKLYENAILKYIADFSASGAYGFNNTTQLYNYTDIGRNINNFNSYFNGQIDEIIIWNRILTDSEVQEVYSKTFKQPIIP